MFLSNLVQKAQQLIDPAALPGPLANLTTASSDRPSKAQLFRHQFRLPETQNPLYEITAELTLPSKPSSRGNSRKPQTYQPHPGAGTAKNWDSSNWDRTVEERGTHYVGQLHISEQFLCFSTVNTTFVSTASTSASSGFTGRTHGTGPAGNGFTLPLCAVRRVERLHTQSYMFALAITTWTGQDAGVKGSEALGSGMGNAPPKLTITLEGSRLQCERFCDGLKKGLRQGMREVENMRVVVAECYSEFFLQGDFEAETSLGVDTRVGVDGKEIKPPDTGLGTLFTYPGNTRKLRDRSKMRLWHEYLRDNGRNTTLVRQPDFHRLIRVGLPNLLRGEIWELTSGSLWLRLQKPKQYEETLKKHEGQQSLAIEEIEKDLNRSLPEYAGFQSSEGIGRLRRVLTAYSWTDTEVGYCQAMNIVVAALLIYLNEKQAFYILSTLCDRLLPGYYSQTMYGTLLDQRVFESLVEKTMPIIWDHLQKNDVQLSVVSLPWFLSLYINSFPLTFAFRVLDVFFLEGPKVLFQIGLAILRINGEELLDATDDGTFISVLKSYFARLGESAHPKSENAKHRQITNFQALMVVAFKEFEAITQQTVSEQRVKLKPGVLEGIEMFAKRTSIRNLGPESKKLSANDLGFLYDRFYAVLYERQQRAQMVQAETERKAKVAKTKATEVVSGISSTLAPEMGRVALGAASTTIMSYDAFREFLAGVAKWAVTDSPSSPTKPSHDDPGYFSSLRNRNALTATNAMREWGTGPEPADHEFLQRLFGKWDSEDVGGLSLQNVVSGLAPIKGGRDLMGVIEWFFELYDDDADGKVDREGILRISEALLFLTRRGVEVGEVEGGGGAGVGAGGAEGQQSRDERFLGAVSAFIRRCFEYADPDHPSRQAQKEVAEATDLLDLTDKKAAGSATEDAILSRPSINTFGQTTPASPSPSTPSKNNTAANAALDPSSPVHITLPTFRMLVLADETLEAFFDSGFANSFHLADAPLASSTITSPSFLGAVGQASASASSAMGASSSGLGIGGGTVSPAYLGLPAISPGGAAAGVVGPGKGLRGVLDNIVTDGMRVAAEVRRRMDEAQRELDRGASGKGGEADDDDEEGEDMGDLLEGAEADAGGSIRSGRSREASLVDEGVGGKGVVGVERVGSNLSKDTMFER
ncbi:GTPase activating protein (GAP) [Recurvomyces mirabilis]|nr:GTPase activating protein (GAP) [Recurvomyces mirabilis]